MAKLQEIIGELYNQLPEETKTKYANANLEDVSEGKYIPKDRFDTKVQEVSGLKEQINTLNGQMEGLKKVDVNELQNTIEKLQQDAATNQKKYEADIAKMEFDNILDKALDSYEVRNKQIVSTLIDKNGLKVNNGEIVGLAEQMEALKKSDDYLFVNKPNGTGSFDTAQKGSEATVKVNPNEDNFAVRAGKRRAESMKAAGINQFINK